MNPYVLATLVKERRQSIARDVLLARRFRLRRRLAAIVYAAAAAIRALAAFVDDDELNGEDRELQRIVFLLS
jgi:hypothetical protein